MAIIRFEPNIPIEIALKFTEGREQVSNLKDKKTGEPLPNDMGYTLCGDDKMYVPLHVAAKITALGIRKMELFSICHTQRGGVWGWEVKRVGDTGTQPIAPGSFEALPTAIDSTPLERKLTDSINQQRQAAPSKVQPAAVATVPAPIKVPTQTPNSSHIHHTAYSRVMAASLIAAIDAAREAERYAAAVGFAVEFVTEDIRAMAATMFINASKDPAFATHPTQKVNGGTTWPA